MFLFTGKTTNIELATHVVQLVFLGDSGFRFPMAQFLLEDCQQVPCSSSFGEGLKKMLEAGFI